MSESTNDNWVVVDWRPYDLPEVFGTFDTEAEATDYSKMHVASIMADEELPDGIVVRQMNRP